LFLLVLSRDLSLEYLDEKPVQHVPGRYDADQLLLLAGHHDHRQARITALIQQLQELREAGVGLAEV